MKKRVVLLTTSALVFGCAAITASAEQKAGSPLMLPAPEPQTAQQPGSAFLPPAQPQTTQQATDPEVPGTALMLPGSALMLPPAQPQTPLQQQTDRDSPTGR